MASSQDVEEIKLIVGLGNPGAEYEGTRHNAGFLVIGSFANELGVNYWKQQCGALVAKVNYKGKDLVLAKPQSYMNRSGGPTKLLMAEYKVAITELVVIHDELDIDKGSARIKFGGGHAGHNGLKSIIEKCGSKDFTRLRIGIGRPPGKMRVPDYVLGRPKGQEDELFDQALADGLTCLNAMLDDGVPKAMSLLNAHK